MMNLLLLVLASPALSATPQFGECLSSAIGGDAAAQPAELTVFGPGSEYYENSKSLEGGAVVGAWTLSCDGKGRFDEFASAPFSGRPVMGQVSTNGVPKAALRCFVESCTLPANTCPGQVDGAPVIEACGGGALTALALSTPGTPRAAPPAPPASAVAAAPQAAPAPRAAAAGAPLLTVRDLALPAAPTGECQIADALKAESRKRVDMGNQAEITGAHADAAGEYRAALTMNPCNANAWTNLGLLALSMSRPDIAARALSAAVRLRPKHYGAATALGDAYASLGQPDLARAAYEKALVARPGHRQALAGLQRLGSGVALR